MTLLDVNAFVGAYPWRRVPATGPEDLLAAMDRTGIGHAWVSHLPGIFWRDPMEGNGFLLDLARTEPRFSAVPAVHPGLAGWRDALHRAVDEKVPAVRCDPAFHMLAPAGSEMRDLAAACGEAGVLLMLAVRLEDGRQRHPRDTTPDLGGADLRALLRCDGRLRLLITHADRALIHEVHFGSTDAEASRVWWDIAWLWGPPEEHVARLVQEIGSDHLVFGTGQPLRIPESGVARLELTDLDDATRAAIGAGNAAVAAGIPSSAGPV